MGRDLIARKEVTYDERRGCGLLGCQLRQAATDTYREGLRPQGAVEGCNIPFQRHLRVKPSLQRQAELGGNSVNKTPKQSINNLVTLRLLI